ncbi:MAG: hypothetical protein V9G08_10260 [Dermatophilaceae bacterium]
MALLIAVVAETGRLPVDNPSTHLELTMIHEAMVLEASGRDLGWVELAAWLRLTGLIGLLVNLAVPWGVADRVAPTAATRRHRQPHRQGHPGRGVCSRPWRCSSPRSASSACPSCMAGSFVLAFLAVTASYLTV